MISAFLAFNSAFVFAVPLSMSAPFVTLTPELFASATLLSNFVLSTDISIPLFESIANVLIVFLEITDKTISNDIPKAAAFFKAILFIDIILLLLLIIILFSSLLLTSKRIFSYSLVIISCISFHFFSQCINNYSHRQ